MRALRMAGMEAEAVASGGGLQSSNRARREAPHRACLGLHLSLLVVACCFEQVLAMVTTQPWQRLRYIAQCTAGRHTRYHTGDFLSEYRPESHVHRMTTAYKSARRGTKRPAPQPEDEKHNDEKEMRVSLDSLQEHIDGIVEDAVKHVDTTLELNKDKDKTPKSMGFEQGRWHIRRVGVNALQLVVNPAKYPGYVYFGSSDDGLSTSPLKQIVEVNPDTVDERDHVFLFITERSMYAVPAKHQRWVDGGLRLELVNKGYQAFGVECHMFYTVL